MNRAFKGVWIPKSILLSKNLSLQEKVFIIEIDSLDDVEKGGCYATNKYFSEFFGLSESRVSAIIKGLFEKKIISRNIKKTQTGSIRFLKVSHYVKTVIAHPQETVFRTSQMQDSHSAESANRIIHSNNTSNIFLKKKISKNKNIINANPRKKS